MIGGTKVTVDYTASTATGVQLNARLYDEFPDGTQVMVDRGPYRVVSAREIKKGFIKGSDNLSQRNWILGRGQTEKSFFGEHAIFYRQRKGSLDELTVEVESEVADVDVTVCIDEHVVPWSACDAAEVGERAHGDRGTARATGGAAGLRGPADEPAGWLRLRGRRRGRPCRPTGRLCAPAAGTCCGACTSSGRCR